MSSFIKDFFLPPWDRNAADKDKDKYQALDQPIEDEIKSETIADNDASYVDHIDPSDAKWIESNDELCSMLLSSPSRLRQQNVEMSEYKDCDMSETEDNILDSDEADYDSFKQLAQDMAKNPNIDTVEMDKSALFPLTSSRLSPSISMLTSSPAATQGPKPMHDVLNTPIGHDSLLTGLYYPVVATLADNANESDIATIIEKLEISLKEDDASLSLNNIILSAFLLSTKTLLFWISLSVFKGRFDEGIIKEIGIQGSVSNLSFSKFGVSPILEITFLSQTFPNDVQRQNLIDKIRRYSEASTIFLRACGFIILFKSISDMNSQVNLLKSLLESDNCHASVIMMNPDEFQYLKCKAFSRNNLSLSGTMFNLRAQGSSLTSLVQSSVCLLPQQPAILAVSTYSHYAQVDCSWWETPLSCLESSGEDIFLLMPSPNDKEIIVSVGSIELPGGYVIVTSPTQARADNPAAESLVLRLSQESNTGPNPLLAKELDVVDISRPLFSHGEDFKSSISQANKIKEVYVFWDIQSCRLSPDDEVEIIVANIEAKLLGYIQEDFRAMRSCFIADVPNYLTEKQRKDISYLFKVIPYSHGVESSMRGEIQKLSDLYTACMKPTMCLIFGNSEDYMSILSTLFLEGFTDTILFNGSDAPLKYPCNRAQWNDIRKMQQFSLNPVPYQSVKPKDFSSDVLLGHSEKNGFLMIPATAAKDRTHEIVDIPSRSVALHFKKLILWGTQDHQGPAKGESTPRLRGEPFLCNDNDEATFVVLNMDDSSEKYCLYVIGSSSVLRIQRANSLKTMVHMASNPRKHDLVAWTVGHVAAFTNSKHLNEAERDFNATVYFHALDRCISAEIVSLTMTQSIKMIEFLGNLIPRKSSMTISKINTNNLSEEHLNNLQNTQAIFVDKNNMQDDGEEVTIDIYGFGLMFQESLANIIQTNKVTKKLTLTCDVTSENYSQADLHRVSPENKNVKKGKGPKTTGSFVFQDREAGMFYTSFESDIRTFVSKKYDVSITETDHHVSENSKVKTSQQSRTPALKIEYAGRNPIDVQNVRNYLEQFNPYYLDRKQIYFPMCDANKYKELNQVKSKQDHLLRNIRNRLLSDKNNLVDPLNSDGFVNIRIKPPMHARGIKRMTLPTDVTVTICSPTGNHEHLQQLRAIEQIFLTIDSGYLTVCVEMQNTSTIAKELTLRSTRDDFINHYNLVGLRWLDEGSRLSNNIGTAKLWASSWKSMDNALEAIKRGGGLIIDETKTTKSSKSNNMDSNLMKMSSEKVETDDRIIVHWPHSSCRYVFLAEPLKKELSDLLNNLRSDHLTITSPYRDKSDHLACMLIEGDNLDHVANQVESYLAKIASQVHGVQIILSDNQKKLLVSNELIGLKAVQGALGVHFLLEPATSDLQFSSAIFDMRVPYNDAKNDYSPNVKHELVSIHVCSKTRQMVELQVFPSSSSGWEVLCCLLIIDDSSSIGLTGLQLSQLNSGHVLVDKDNLTGKMLLRSKILNGDLESAVSRGLNIAEQLQIEGVTILAPTNLDLKLSLTEIRTMTLEMIINIIWTKAISNIKKIICVEMEENSEAKEENVGLSLLEPGRGCQLALSLLYILQKSNNNQNIQLNYCNVPLPRTIPAESIMRRNIEPRAKSGPVVIKGLVPALIESIIAVKSIIL